MANDTLKKKIYANKIAEEIEGHYSSRQDVGHGDNIVFAISGKWGEGKTELLNLLEPKLINKRFTVVRFNPWQYSQEDISLKRSFLRVVKDKLQSDVDLSDLYYDRSKTIIDWKSFLDPLLKGILVIGFVVFLLIPGIFGYPIDIWWNDVASALKSFWGSGFGGAVITALIIPLLIKTIVVSSRAAQVTTAEEFEDKFRELLNGKSKVVVFIDDLDRCTSKTVKIVLDSLRTFFCHTECSYVITGDHTVIERYAAEELNPKKDEFTGKDIEEGRRFLKKLFDVYWRLPLATPRVFKEFIADELKKSAITLTDQQSKNVDNFLSDDGFFERNPRHVKRFITALKFALESVKAQIEELSQGKNEDADTKEQKKSIEEILNNPDLLAKTLLVQEKFYPVYEKLILYPAEIVNHEKSLRAGNKPEDLVIANKKVLEILENDTEGLKNYAALINLEPQFTDAYNSTTFDPTNFLAFSGATGLPSLKGPDEANFPQYIKAGQLVERLGSNLEAVPTEKRERFAQRALQIYDDATTVEQEKLNVISESLKEAALLDEWATKLDQWKQKLFALPVAQQNTLAKDFWVAVLQKSPKLLQIVKQEKPAYFESLWPILEPIDEVKLHPDTKPQLETILKDVIGVKPLSLKGVKIYLDKFGSRVLEEEINTKLIDLPTAREYFEHCQALTDPNGKIAGIVLQKMKGLMEDFATIDWIIQNREFLKTVNLFGHVKYKIAQWSKDQKQIIKIANSRDALELTDQEKGLIRDCIVELTNKSSDLQFVENGDIQAILDKDSRIKIFEGLVNILSDNNESMEKRKKAGILLNKNNALWNGLDINDFYSFLKQLKKLKLGRTPDLKDFPKEILDSWGYNETDKKEEEK